MTRRAGKGNGAEDWLQVLDPDDPEHEAPRDGLPWGFGKLIRSDDAVLRRPPRRPIRPAQPTKLSESSHSRCAFAGSSA
jgi:hypothetical protein